MIKTTEEKKKIIREFRRNRSLYEAFSSKMENLVRDIFKEKDIKVHSISSRTKTPKRFIKKLIATEKYKDFKDMTDLSGVRIICLFSDRVDEIATIIKECFDVQEDLSVDKRKSLESDRFGYLSLHYVVKLSDKRASLQEYGRYAGLLCEIQIRSVLQHAWAEIEHDLGYKSDIEIPRDMKRKFYMLAGLLELADAEFVHLKKDVRGYIEKMKRIIEIPLSPLEQQEIPSKLPIDKTSLSIYLERSTTVKGLNNAIRKAMKALFLEKTEVAEIDLNRLRFFGIDDIRLLDKILKDNFNEIIKFATEWNRQKNIDNKEEQENNNTPVFVDKTIGIFYMAYLLVGKKEDIKQIVQYVSIFLPAEQVEEVSREVLNTYKKINE